ncbi:MAG: DUF2062 domain-containing protein, partial [Planctomycetota bacterium]
NRLKRFKRFLKFRILHANDSPHRIALGAAIGVFISWTPALGLHILMIMGVTALLRANKFAAFVSIWINNPFTIVGIYYPNYLLGRMLLKPFYSSSGTELQMQKILSQLGPSEVLAGIFTVGFWRDLLTFLWQKGPELWLGSIVIGVLVGIVSYIVVYKTVGWYRNKNPRRRFLRYQ